MRIKISTYNQDQHIITREYELDLSLTPDRAHELLMDIIDDSQTYIEEEADMFEKEQLSTNEN